MLSGARRLAVRLQVPLSEEELLEKSSKPEKMSIGGEGGFQVSDRPSLNVANVSRTFDPETQASPRP